MKLEDAERIVELALDHGHDMELREDYSGRGMYGKETTAVIGDAYMIYWAAGALGISPKALRVDSMGKSDTIVY